MTFEIDEDLKTKKERYDEHNRSSEVLERVHERSDYGVN
jgi:hypothetical protein